MVSFVHAEEHSNTTIRDAMNKFTEVIGMIQERKATIMKTIGNLNDGTSNTEYIPTNFERNVASVVNKSDKNIKFIFKGKITVLPFKTLDNSSLNLDAEIHVLQGIKISSSAKFTQNHIPEINSIDAELESRLCKVKTTIDIKKRTKREIIKKIEASSGIFTAVVETPFKDEKKLSLTVHALTLSGDLKFEEFLTNFTQNLKIKVDLNKLFGLMKSDKIQLTAPVSHISTTISLDLDKKEVVLEIKIMKTIKISIKLNSTHLDKWKNNGLWEAIKQIFLMIFADTKEGLAIEISEKFTEKTFQIEKQEQSKYKYLTI